MITITIEQLKARAQHRPAGYVDDVLSMATRDGDTLRLTPAAWTALRAKYQHATPDETPLLPEIIRRFEICKTCSHSIDGHQCDLHKTCCFGRWRSNPENQCPAGKWPVGPARLPGASAGPAGLRTRIIQGDQKPCPTHEQK